MTRSSKPRPYSIRGLAWVTSLALGSSCCSDDPGLPRAQTEAGEIVMLSTTRDIPLARGTITRLDRSVEKVLSELAIEPQSLDLIVVEPEIDLTEDCTVASGCYLPCSDLSVVSEAWTLSITLHELQHQIASNSRIGSTNLFLSEGFASLFGSTRCIEEPGDYDLAKLLGLPAGAGLIPAEYTLAAKFLQHLRMEFGSERLLTALSDLDPDDDVARIDSVFLEVFGEPLGEIEQRFDPAAITFEERNCAVLTTLKPVNEAWEIRGPISIDAPETFNTFTGPDGRGLGVEVGIDLPDASYSISLAGDSSTHAWVHTCTCSRDYGLSATLRWSETSTLRQV